MTELLIGAILGGMFICLVIAAFFGGGSMQPDRERWSRERAVYRAEQEARRERINEECRRELRANQ